MVDAGSVADDEGRSVIALGFLDRLQELVLVGAHGDLSDVDVAVAGCHHAQILLLGLLAAGRELRDGSSRRCLGGLAAGVGVDFGIEYEDVDVFAGSEDVVESAVTDVVGPAVTAEAPDALLDQEVFLGLEFLLEFRSLAGQLRGVDRGHQRFGLLSGGGAVFHAVDPGSSSFLDGSALRGCGQFFDDVLDLRSVLADGRSHTETELSVVFEQGVRPGRTSALLVGGIRHGRCGSAPDGGAARRVRDHHAVTEQLRNDLDVRGLAAACACAGEFEVREGELGTLDGTLVHDSLLADLHAELPVGAFSFLRSERFHGESLLALLARADVGAVAAAEAVERGDLHSVCHAGDFLADGGDGREACRCLCLFVLGQQDRTDRCVRADEGALVALDAVFRMPHGYLDRNAALLVSSGAAGERAVFDAFEGGDGQLVAFLAVHRYEDLFDEFGDLLGLCGLVGCGLPRSGDLDLMETGETGVHGSPVHLDDVLALLAVGLLDGLLQILFGIFHGNDLREREERGLHDHVDPVAQTDLDAQVGSVDGVELDVVLGDVLLHGSGQMLFERRVVPGAVQQERAALLQTGQNVVCVDVGFVVACDEVCLGDEVGGLDRVLAESQVGNGDAAGLLGVIGEVALRVHVGVVADDLDGLLVGADGTVGTQTPELAAIGAFGLGRDLDGLQRSAVQVVVDADGEVVLGLLCLQVVVDCDDLARRGVLGAEAVAAAVDLRRILFGVVHGLEVHVERIAHGAGFLRSVEDGDSLDGLRHDLLEVLRRPGSVQSDLDEADLLALSQQMRQGLFDRFADGAHGDDDVLRVGSADIVERLILSADLLAELLHVIGNDVGQRFVVLVRSFSGLEEDIRVLSGAADDGMLGIQGSVSEGLDGIHVDQLPVDVIVHDFDLLDLVGRAETVEIVQERYSALDGGQVCDRCQVHDLLDGAGAQQGETGLAAGHDVGVIAEDAQCVRSQGSRGHVEHAGEKFACDLVHVGDHEEQALGRGVGGGESAGCEGAVDRTGCAAFGLHLYDADFLTEQVLFSMRCHVIHDLSHRGGRSDGENRGNVGERIRDVCGSGVAIHGFEFLCHDFFSPLLFISNVK